MSRIKSEQWEVLNSIPDFKDMIPVWSRLEEVDRDNIDNLARSQFNNVFERPPLNKELLFMYTVFLSAMDTGEMVRVINEDGKLVVEVMES